jgi:hypothetical protein
MQNWPNSAVFAIITHELKALAELLDGSCHAACLSALSIRQKLALIRQQP